MKKVGVITFSSETENYGAVLQYLATQEFLKEFDFDVYLLRPRMKIPPLWRRILNKLIRTMRNIKTVAKPQIVDEKTKLFREMHKNDVENEKLHPRRFEEFRKKNFKIIKDYISNLERYNLDFFCVGSDQVWTGSPYLFFLEFVPDGIKRFSIAPSVGHKMITDNFVNEVSVALSKFNFITVREKSGLNLCQRAGRSDAHLVLDPTFLLKKEDYNRYTSQNTIKNKPYIFLYLLGTQIDLNVKEIFDFAKTKGLDIKYVASQGRFDDLPKLYPTIDEWLSLISNADYVITNSFHGTAFSIIYQKPFLTIPITGILSSMNERIENLLDSIELSERICKKGLDQLFEPISWLSAEKKIKENKCLMDSLIKSL